MALSFGSHWVPTYRGQAPEEWTLPPRPAARPTALQAELVLLDTGERAYGGTLPCDLPLQPLAGPPRASTAPTLLAIHVPLAAYPFPTRANPTVAPVLRVTAGPQLLASVRLPPPQRVVGARTVAWLRIEGAVAAAQRTVPLAATLQRA